MTRLFSGIIFLALIVAISRCFALPAPPQDAIALQRGRMTFFAGTVYLSSCDDTMRLKEMGFCHLVYEGRSFGSVKYQAEWPASAVAQPAPDYLNGINYDLSRPDRPSFIAYWALYDDDYGGGSAAYPGFGSHRDDFSDDRPLFVPTHIGGSCNTRRG